MKATSAVLTCRAIVLLHLLTTIQGQDYFGCFVNADNPRILNHKLPDWGNTTVDNCIRRCREQNFTYAGVEYHKECFCGDSHNHSRHGIANESECNTPCDGNSSQMCGGAYRTNIYSVCNRGMYSRENGQSGNCDFSCHCLDNTICLYGNGVCPNGGSCARGWTGSSCEFINCIESGCEQRCEAGQREDACRCHPGYIKNATFCDDIDECSPTNTHNCSDICDNTPGSYVCKCHGGYELLEGERFVCTDFDECGIHNGHNCSDICSNTAGSYVCDCHAGFEFRAGDRFKCKDIDECAHPNTHNCSNICKNTRGSYVCKCHDGYELVEGESFVCTGVPGNNAVAIGVGVGVSVLIIFIIIIIIVVIIWRRKKGKESEKEQRAENKNSSLVLTDIGHENVVMLDDRSSIGTSESVEQKSVGPSPRNTRISEQTPSNFIPLKKLSSYIVNILRHRSGLEEEYESVRVSYGSTEKAEDETLKPKNKYRNILPYDDNTVRLSDTGEPYSDYINASFIKFEGETDMVIAAQGPTPAAVDDFWRMVWEHDVVVIAMLAKCIEGRKNKCTQYWPDEGQKEYGDVTVVLGEEREYPTHAVRALTISHVNCKEKRTVHHYHFTSWPDKGVPVHVAPFLSFHGKVQKATVSGRPTIIHCSAGVGRTGTFLAFGRLLRQSKIEGGVDFLKCLHEMRKQRMRMIQTLEQYVFLHSAVMDSVTVGDTALPLGDFSAVYSNLQTSVSPINTSYISAQYKLLALIPALTYDTASAAHDPENEMKNRTDILPADLYRVRLMSGPSDYINALSIVGYKNTDKYMVTQWPLQDTVEDLWMMIYDYSIECVIVLEDMKDMNSYPDILPTVSKDVPVDNKYVTFTGEVTQHGQTMSLTKISSHPKANIVNDDIYANAPAVIQKSDDKSEEKLVCILQAVNAEAEDQSLSLESVGSLQNEAESIRKSSSPILLLSRDGGDLCGQYLALCMAKKMAKEENQVDFFCIVQQIKSRRPEFFDTEGSYQKLYEKTSEFFT